MILSRQVRYRHLGLSLLEVLVALTVFVIAFVILGHLITWGGKWAQESQLRSEAVQLCQTKLAEVRAGAEPLTPQHGMPFAESPAWLWDLECEQQNSVPNLWQVQVRVSRADAGSSPFELTLTQWLLDPRSRGSVFDLAAYDSANGSGSSTSSSTGSSSAPGNTGNTGAPGGS